MVEAVNLIKAELHCHSSFSVDGRAGLEELIRGCLEKKIGLLALTDHNEIAGALELKEIAPKELQIVIGEEITTAQGDLIGLFLKEKIGSRLDIVESIRLIHAQGGLALLPHPFDQIRREAVGAATAELVKDKIDFLEVFNSRCLLGNDNQAALEFAQNNKIPGYVGSDAHTIEELGRAVCVLKTHEAVGLADDPAAFRLALEEATFQKKSSGLLPHLKTKFDKLRRNKP